MLSFFSLFLLFITNNNASEHVALRYDDDNSRSRWTTANGTGSQPVGIACGGGVGTSPGEEEFVVTRLGGLKMLRDTNVPNDYLIEITQSNTAADHGNMIFHQSQGRKTLTFKRTDGDIDLSGNIQIDPLAKFKSLSAPTAGTTAEKALTIGGGYTSAANSQPEGFELEHEYNNASN